MPRSLPPIHMTDPLDNELSEYRALAGQAVVALLLGLLSPLAFIDPFLLIVPGLGVFFGIWATRRIKSNATAMAGRKRAIFGLAMSLLVIVAVPVDWVVEREIFCRQARQFGETWFKHLIENRPGEALLMTYVPEKKSSGGPGQEPDSPQESDADRFVKHDLVKTLLALGPRAQVRFYQTADVTREQGADSCAVVFAVTYDGAAVPGGTPERTTFFAALTVRRQRTLTSDIIWKVYGVSGGVRPPGW